MVEYEDNLDWDAGQDCCAAGQATSGGRWSGSGFSDCLLQISNEGVDGFLARIP